MAQLLSPGHSRNDIHWRWSDSGDFAATLFDEGDKSIIVLSSCLNMDEKRMSRRALHWFAFSFNERKQNSSDFVELNGQYQKLGSIDHFLNLEYCRRTVN